MANKILNGLLGFAVLVLLIFIAVQLFAGHSHDQSGGGTVIVSSWPSWRPWTRPYPPRYPRPTPPRPTPPRPIPPPVQLIGGCSGTRYGCCADGRTAKKDAVGSNCLLY